MTSGQIAADALLLDMDGVLVDSNATVESHWSQWAARRGLPVAEVLRGAHGTPTRDNVARFVGADEVAAETDWIESLPVDGDDDVALPGAAAALSQGVMPVAVVTSAPNQVARWRLERAGLTVPVVVVGADDVALGKPDPAPYLRAAALLGVEPSRCVGVEDSRAGLAALHAAGGGRSGRADNFSCARTRRARASAGSGLAEDRARPGPLDGTQLAGGRSVPFSGAFNRYRTTRRGGGRGGEAGWTGRSREHGRIDRL